MTQSLCSPRLPLFPPILVSDWCECGKVAQHVACAWLLQILCLSSVLPWLRCTLVHHLICRLRLWPLIVYAPLCTSMAFGWGTLSQSSWSGGQGGRGSGSAWDSLVVWRGVRDVGGEGMAG